MAATATTALAAVLATSAPADAATTHKPVPHTRPTWLNEARHLGTAAASTAVSARVYLAPQGGTDALKAAVTAMSTPGSATYHHFLTVAQYRARYAPSAAEVASVRSYLVSTGLKVTGVEASHRYLTVSGNVAAAQKAFGTTIGHFQHDGQDVQAPTADVVLPAAIAASVLTVTGLDTSTHKMAPASKQPEAAPPAGFRNARPCSINYGQVLAKFQADYKTPLPTFQGKSLPYAVCGYTGPQLRSAYEGDTDLDGTGVTVAIVDAYASPTIAKDANTYAENHGDGSYAPGQLTQTTFAPFAHGTDCGGQSGWYGEETLDVEAVHAMAPGANIHYYGAKSCYDVDLTGALTQIDDDNTAKVVTNSYGEPEEGEDASAIAAEEQALLQGEAQGISFLFSSGDNGDELANTGVKQADYPASDPYSTAVGGTSTAINRNPTTGAPQLAWEAGWGTQKYSLSADGKSWTPIGYLYGAGGGASALFDQPAYQAGVAPSNGYRDVPDVAMDADPTTGMLVGETQTFSTGVAYGEYRIGGTSLASPLFAGLTALALQGKSTGSGLLNPTIYKNATSGAFLDVKGAPKDAGNIRVDFKNGENATGGLLYSVRTFGQDSSLAVTKGWDYVTGVGSPTTKWLTALS